MRKGLWAVVSRSPRCCRWGCAAGGGKMTRRERRREERCKAPKGPKALAKLGQGEGKVNLIAWAGG